MYFVVLANNTEQSQANINSLKSIALHSQTALNCRNSITYKSGDYKFNELVGIDSPLQTLY